MTELSKQEHLRELTDAHITDLILECDGLMDKLIDVIRSEQLNRIPHTPTLKTSCERGVARLIFNDLKSIQEEEVDF